MIKNGSPKSRASVPLMKAAKMVCEIKEECGEEDDILSRIDALNLSTRHEKSILYFSEVLPIRVRIILSDRDP